MQRQRIRQGDRIVITDSWSSDVQPGTEGVIEKTMPGGYAVVVHAIFSDALGRRAPGTRCMFFRRGQVKLVPQAEKPVENLGGS